MPTVADLNSPECLVRLRSVYSSLNPATRKAADYILAHPHEVIEDNIIQLSSKVDVSQFSIINCVKMAGYKGYRDFKIALARGLNPDVKVLMDNIAPDDNPYDILKKVTQRKIQSLNDTLSLIDEDRFCKAVDLISEAERIELYALGYSFFAADFLHMNLKRLYKHANVYRDPNYQRMGASLMQPGELAIGISTSGATKSVVDSLKIAKQHEAATLAITSNENSPITEYADATLITMFSEPTLLKETNSSVAEQITLASALTIALASKDMPNAFVSLSESTYAIHQEQQQRW